MQYRPAVPNLKQILMQKWHLIQQQPLLRGIFKDPPIVFVQKGQIPEGYTHQSKTLTGYYTWMGVVQACHPTVITLNFTSP